MRTNNKMTRTAKAAKMTQTTNIARGNDATAKTAPGEARVNKGPTEMENQTAQITGQTDEDENQVDGDEIDEIDETDEIDESEEDAGSTGAVNGTFAAHRTGKAGRALSALLGGERVTAAIDDAPALIAKVQSMQVNGLSIPVAYAGGSYEALRNAYTADVIIGFLSRKADKVTDYIALVAIPSFSVADILEAGEVGANWLAKLVEKELAAVGWRPVRNLDDGMSFADAAGLIPTDLGDYLTTQSRGIPGMELLTYLWPHAYAAIKEGYPQIAPFLPKPSSKTSLDIVSKALRSASWARRNTEALELHHVWAGLVGPSLTGAAIEGLNLVMAEVSEKDNIPFTPFTADVFEGWLANRDEVDIEPIGTRTPKDLSAIEAFGAQFEKQHAGN